MSIDDASEAPRSASAPARTATPEDGARADVGAFPRLVIPGESSDTVELPSSPRAWGAMTDYLNVSFPMTTIEGDPGRFLSEFVSVAVEICGGLTDRKRPLHHYKRSFEFDNGAILLGLDGPKSTALLSIPGEGCALLGDLARLTPVLRNRLGGRISRWDGAVDDFEGAHSVDLAVELWKLGGFNSGGRTPAPNQHGNWLAPDGSGRTFEVGNRKNGKMLRVYEKGMQLGRKFDPWTRWEVELHNRDRVIPWDVLARPGDFVAGAYPCLGWVQGTASRVATIRKQDGITYAALTSAANRAYGGLVNVMLEREGNAASVLDKLVRPGIVPKRLRFTDGYLKGDGNARE